jgi:hypothetical protein
MAVIYIEEGQEYEGTKHAHRARIFQEHLKISEVYGFTLFFSNLLPELLQTSLDFFQTQAKKLRKQAMTG